MFSSTLGQLANRNGARHGTLSAMSNDLGGGGLETGLSGPGLHDPQIMDTLPGFAPSMDPTKAAPAWQMPSAAFAPGASQNGPRLFQDPTSGQWTLSEHGNFRPVPAGDVANTQTNYVDKFWSDPNIVNGFIQPGHANYDPTQAMSNEQYGQPANWQSLWTNAGQQVPGAAALNSGMNGDPGGMGGTLSELSNPERVEQLSQSSYGNPLLVR